MNPDKCIISGCNPPADSYNRAECRKHAHVICEVDGCYRPTCTIYHKCSVHTYIRNVLLCAQPECPNRSIPIHYTCETHFDESDITIDQNLFITDNIVQCTANAAGWNADTNLFDITPLYHYLCAYHNICQYVMGLCLNITKMQPYCHQHKCVNGCCSQSNVCTTHTQSNMIILYGANSYLSIIPQDIIAVIICYVTN